MNEPGDDLMLNKKNYALWRLGITDQLQKRQWFGFTVNDDRYRDRPSYHYHNRATIRERKEECLQYLFSKVNLEIYEEIKHLGQACKVWSYLEKRYSKNGMKRLNAAMKELQTMRFNLESFDLFIEKFRRAARKVEDCGLHLEDSYLNLYCLASLQRCNRIENPGDFYTSIGCKFDEFLVKIKDKIINPPDIEYSDISDDSMLSFDDEEEASTNETNNMNPLPSLVELSARIDQNLQRFGVEGDDWESDSERVDQKKNEKKDCENDEDSKSDYKDARDQLDDRVDKFNRLVDEGDRRELERLFKNDDLKEDKRAEAFPSLLSPIKTPCQATEVSADEMETDENPDESKVYEDLNPANYDAVRRDSQFGTAQECANSELETAISSITNGVDRSNTQNSQPDETVANSSYFFYDRNGSR